MSALGRGATRSRRTSSTSTPTTPVATSSPMATRSRPPTSSCWPTKASCSAPPSARRRPAQEAARSLLTGQYCHNNGMLGLAHRGWSLNDYRAAPRPSPSRSAGYYSALIGEQHISRDTGVIGYDDVVEVDSNHAGDVAPIGDLDDARVPQAVLPLGRVLRDPPEVLGAHLRARHPLLAPAAEPSRHTCGTRRDMAAFKASARSLDQGIGSGAARASTTCGLADSTLIICTTDHGLAFPGAKATLVRSRPRRHAACCAGPGGFAGGQVFDAMVTHLDVYPTICDLAGVEHPPWLQGDFALAAGARGDGASPRRRSSRR